MNTPQNRPMHLFLIGLVLLVAVIIPIVCGLLRMADHRIPFVGGAALSLVSLAFVQCIGTENP